MGKIVAAMACSHAPQILIDPKISEVYSHQLKGVQESLLKLRFILMERKPDALIVFSADHVEAWFFNLYPQLCVYVGSEVKFFLADKFYQLRSHEGLAKTVHLGLVQRGFDPAFSQEAVFGHGYITPLGWILKDYDLPVVIVHLNGNVAPLMPPRRCLLVGKAIADIIARERPKDERVALLATGGLSHFPGTPSYGKLDLDADRKILDALREGEGEKLAELPLDYVEETGNFELIAWLAVVGAIGKVRAEVLLEQPTFHINYAVVNFPLNTRGR